MYVFVNTISIPSPSPLHIFTHPHLYPCIHQYTHTYIHTRAHPRPPMYTHTHTYTHHTYTYTRTCKGYQDSWCGPPVCSRSRTLVLRACTTRGTSLPTTSPCGRTRMVRRKGEGYWQWLHEVMARCRVSAGAGTKSGLGSRLRRCDGLVFRPECFDPST